MPFRIKVSLAILLALATMLLLGPLLAPVPALEGTVPARELAGPDSRFAEVGGLELHYVEQRPGPSVDAEDGTRPVFLLLHDYANSVSTWQAALDGLGGLGRAVAFDRPGFGLSERPLPGDWERGGNPYAPDAQVRHSLGLMDELGIDRAVLVGSSSGARVALQIALDHPERVSALVLVSPAVYRVGGPPAWLRPLLHSPQLERVGPLLLRQLGGEPGLNLLRSAWAEPERISEARYAAFSRFTRADHWDRALWEVTKASRPGDLARRLGEIGVPTLVIAGTTDAITPVEEAERLARELPDADLVLLEGCGHLSQEECPGAFVEALAGWLGR